jgi:hypothetical protein
MPPKLESDQQIAVVMYRRHDVSQKAYNQDARSNRTKLYVRKYPRVARENGLAAYLEPPIQSNEGKGSP